MSGTTLPEDPTLPSPTQEFEIRFPEHDPDSRGQHEEWCELHYDGEWRRIRFHDYAEIYEIPGLYEELFYERLRCQSPRTVREMLGERLREEGRDAAELRVLDVGAGNGIVGEELSELGVSSIIGVDIIDEAAAAAERDRPGIYADYLVADLTAVDDGHHRLLEAGRFNCLTSVAALGFDDIPPAAFAGGFRYLTTGGLAAISLKADFATGEDPSGFSRMIADAIGDGTLEVINQRLYRHRLAASGEPIDYRAIVARKRAELPERLPGS